MSTDPEPTREELLAMAYVDGEVDPAGRREFEALLAEREDLQLQVAQLRRLEVVARQAAPPEPMDHEWERIRKDPMHQSSHGLGFGLLIVGSVGIVIASLVGIWQGDESLFTKGVLSSLIVGALILFANTLQNRLRTLPYDPYTEIQR